MALLFQFVKRLSAFARLEVPGYVWRCSKYSSGGAKTSSFWLKKSIPPAATSLRLCRAVWTAWNVAVSPPVKRSAASPFVPSAVVCRGLVAGQLAQVVVCRQHAVHHV